MSSPGLRPANESGDESRKPALNLRGPGRDASAIEVGNAAAAFELRRTIVTIVEGGTTDESLAGIGVSAAYAAAVGRLMRWKKKFMHPRNSKHSANEQ